MSYLDYVVSKSTPRMITFGAVTMGFLAIVRSWTVVYPARRKGLTGSPALIAFEVFKVAALFLILGWVFLRNRNEHDRTVRSKREYAFSLAAALSVLIDVGIWFAHQS